MQIIVAVARGAVGTAIGRHLHAGVEQGLNGGGNAVLQLVLNGGDTQQLQVSLHGADLLVYGLVPALKERSRLLVALIPLAVEVLLQHPSADGQRPQALRQNAKCTASAITPSHG